MMWNLFLGFLGLVVPRAYYPWLRLIEAFPGLFGTGFQFTSNPTGRYNCIAWAAGDTNRWWQPGLYWPVNNYLGRGDQIGDLIAAYQTRGFNVCTNGAYQNGIEKIALYAINGRWTHAAKQLDANWWSSKLGKNYDISHRDPDDLSGTAYGQVAAFMSR